MWLDRMRPLEFVTTALAFRRLDATEDPGKQIDTSFSRLDEEGELPGEASNPAVLDGQIPSRLQAPERNAYGINSSSSLKPSLIEKEYLCST